MDRNGQYSQSRLPIEQGSAPRWVAHVDMDAFFASIEQRDDPSQAGRPLIVGNSPLPMERLHALVAEAQKRPHMPEFIKGVRGVVASASYEARRFGVRSAMPLAKALALCPEASVMAGRFDRYREVAEQLRQVWAEFSPVVEPASLDEAYLDMTGSEVAAGRIYLVAERLKTRIRQETGLTASAGLASSKLVAKIASDLDKPDGLVIVPHGEEAATLAPLLVRALPGVGPRTAEALAVLGIKTVGQLAMRSQSVLARVFGAEQADNLLRRANGIDNSPVEIPGDPKSISREITLAEDLSDLDELKSQLRPLADHVAWTLRREGFQARCVYIKLRLLPKQRIWRPEGPGFGRLITRRCTLPVPVASAQAVYGAAAKLLEVAAKGTGLGEGKEIVRLLGVGTATLSHVPRYAQEPDAGHGEAQPLHPQQAEDGPLFSRDREHRLDVSVDQIRERYGFDAISFGGPAKRGDSLP